MKKLIVTLMAIMVTNQVMSMERIGRLGLGFTNQISGNTPSLSFKLQKSKAFAFGGFFGLNSSETGGWNAGIKLHRNIFDEPQLTFYSHMLAALINQKTGDIQEKTGFQVDLGFGTEFSFQGLQSLGFSVEFGFSFTKIDEFSIKTAGNNFLSGALHFYL